MANQKFESLRTAQSLARRRNTLQRKVAVYQGEIVCLQRAMESMKLAAEEEIARDQLVHLPAVQRTIQAAEGAAMVQVLTEVNEGKLKVKGEWDTKLHAQDLLAKDEAYRAAVIRAAELALRIKLGPVSLLNADEAYRQMQTLADERGVMIASAKSGIDFRSTTLRVWFTARETAIANLQFAAALGNRASILQIEPMLPPPDSAE